MDETEFEYRGHWVQIDMLEVGEDRWRATYGIDGQGIADVAGRPIPYNLVLMDAQRNAKASVDRMIQRAAASGNTVVLVGTSHYQFETAEEAAEASAWLSWVVSSEGDFAIRFPNGVRVAFLGGSQGGEVQH